MHCDWLNTSVTNPTLRSHISPLSKLLVIAGPRAVIPNAFPLVSAVLSLSTVGESRKNKQKFPLLTKHAVNVRFQVRAHVPPGLILQPVMGQKSRKAPYSLAEINPVVVNSDIILLTFRISLPLPSIM